jgi:hypothetical protein
MNKIFSIIFTLINWSIFIFAIWVWRNWTSIKSKLNPKVIKILKYFAAVLGGLVLILIAVMFYAFSKGFGPGLADYTYKIADICDLGRSSAHMISIRCEGFNGGVSPKVIKVGWNDNFLIAYTHPVTKLKYPENPENTYSEPDESITYWWVMDLKTKELYGPINSEQAFENKKSELGIGDIQLWSVNEAKSKGVWLHGDFRDK